MSNIMNIMSKRAITSLLTRIINLFRFTRNLPDKPLYKGDMWDREFRHHVLHLLEEQLLSSQRTERLLTELVAEVRSLHHYSVYISRQRLTQGDFLMAIGSITVGQTGTFAAQLEDNGSPIALPTGSTFAWTASDTTVTFETSADTLSTVVTVPAGDTGTSVTITASTTDPNGNPVAGSVTVAITPEAQQFTVTVTQTA
jgi:hypothetical protein